MPGVLDTARHACDYAIVGGLIFQIFINVGMARDSYL